MSPPTESSGSGLLDRGKMCDGHDNDRDRVVPPNEIDDERDGFDECGGLECAGEMFVCVSRATCH